MMAKETNREPGPERVERRINAARDSLPGQRDGLPEEALGGLSSEPQADEKREPAPSAPTIPS
jgi:hypothetical protein